MRDDRRQRTRVLLTTLDETLGALGGTPEASAVRAAFAALQGELDLGPEEQVRPCPVCGAIGMSAATRCGTCWSKLTPVIAEVG
jgi:hypothetical protein